MRITFSIFFCLVSIILFAQSQPVALFSYDGCSLTNDIGSGYNAGTEIGVPGCECGVVLNSLDLDGVDDCATLDPRLKELLISDFTFSFYFFRRGQSVPAPIFSIKDSCLNRDSSLLIRYLPLNDEVEISMGENIADLIIFNSPLQEDKCWHQITLTKNGETYSFYLNGEFVESNSIGLNIPLGVNHPFEIGNSSCVGIVDQKFNGLVDEITFYDRSLSAEEISNWYAQPDEILSADTTIFIGNSVQIAFEGSCGNIFWDPSSSLNGSDINPIATPDLTTSYTMTSDYGNCITKDTITINVIDEDDITCEQLLLPNAFTPNGDGVNDRFGISNLFIVQALESFTIYDRWGAKIYNSTIKGDQWDGFFNGTAVNAGMYAYKIQYSCESQSFEKIGSVSVLR